MENKFNKWFAVREAAFEQDMINNLFNDVAVEIDKWFSILHWAIVKNMGHLKREGLETLEFIVSNLPDDKVVAENVVGIVSLLTEAINVAEKKEEDLVEIDLGAIKSMRNVLTPMSQRNGSNVYKVLDVLDYIKKQVMERVQKLKQEMLKYIPTTQHLLPGVNAQDLISNPVKRIRASKKSIANPLQPSLFDH